MNKIKITIIIPIYNAEKYIAECLNSCLNQSIGNYEVIVVNDGSTDTSEQIINDYIKNNYNLSSYNIKNSGAGIARNYGLARAKGEYISFVDADDVIYKTFCEDMLYQAKKYDADIVRCDYERVLSMNNINKTSSIKFNNYINNYGNIINSLSASSQLLLWHLPCTGIYRKSLIDKINFKFPSGIIEDPVTKILFLEANKIVLYPWKLYLYRTNANQTTNNIDFQKREIALKRWVNIFNYYESKSCLYNSGIIESFFYSAAGYTTLINEIEFNSLTNLKNNFKSGKYNDFIKVYKKLDGKTNLIVRATGIKKSLYKNAIIALYEERYILAKLYIKIVAVLAKIRLIF
ncbi:MAG: glycosyltransferase family 2 protein, partial [Bacilli bacterium]